METWNADRVKLQAEVVEAVKRLLRHTGAGAFMLPLNDHNFIVVGSPDEVIELAKSELD
jgi:hypothetical protein